MTWWKPWTWQADPKWSVLSGLPTVQFRMVFLSLLDAFTLAGIAHTIETIMHNGSAASRADPLVLEIWIAWLTLLGGLHGLGYAGYRTKRNTSWDGNLEEDRGKPTVQEPERPAINPETGEIAVVGMNGQPKPPTPPNQFAPPPNALVSPRPDLGVPDKGVL